jgi:hypothetical protein
MMNGRFVALSLSLATALTGACRQEEPEEDPGMPTPGVDAGMNSPVTGGSGGSTGGSGGSTGGSGGSTGGSDGSTGGSGGSTGGSGGAGGSSVGGNGGSGALPGVVTRTNIPGLKFEYKGTDPAARGIEILSSNLTQEAIGSSVFQEWLAEVKNSGPLTVCLLSVSVRFQSGGTVLAEIKSYADGPPYLSGLSGVTSTCLAPGDTGVFWDLDQLSRTTPIQSATTAEYTLDYLPQGQSRPHPDAPTIAPGAVVDRFNTGTGWILKGTVTARATIYNIGLDIYPIDETGLVTDSLSATHLETLPAGSTWSFDSSSTKRRFSRHHVFADWIDGVKRAELRSRMPLPADELRQDFRDRRHLLKRERALLRLQP